MFPGSDLDTGGGRCGLYTGDQKRRNENELRHSGAATKQEASNQDYSRDHQEYPCKVS